ncbi:MAG TPA: sulfatase, partial [Spirochaetia bacterium]|nr:sulfatase [Spirochaetia bacterium]
SAPVCSPTRASLMTGKYPARVGITQYIGGHTVGRLCDVPYFWGLPLSEISLATALGRGGYATWHVGKWHLGDGLMMPESHGFEVNIGGCGWGHPHNGYFSPYGIPTLDDGPDGEYLSDRLTNEAIKLIQQRDSRPFFLHLSHYAVHTPIQAPAPLVDKYRQKARNLGLDRMTAIEPGDHFPCIHKRTMRIERRIIQSDPTYAAMIENLDVNVGRVLDAVRSEGIERETIVIFTSDNGGLSTAEGSPTCNLPLAEGKGWMYEGGTRVVQIVSWPDVVAPGSRSSIPCTTTDWYPTLLEASGLPPLPEQHVDGVSILPAISGMKGFHRPPLFWHYPHYSNQGGTPAISIRDGDYKLIEFFEDNHLELYNLANDVSEKQNKIGSDRRRAEELHAQLSAWRAEVQALIPKPNPNWEERPSSADGATD